MPPGPVSSLRSCLSLLVTPAMASLAASFLYSGLSTAFWSGVLPSAAGFTPKLGYWVNFVPKLDYSNLRNVYGWKLEMHTRIR